MCPGPDASVLVSEQRRELGSNVRVDECPDVIKIDFECDFCSIASNIGDAVLGRGENVFRRIVDGKIDGKRSLIHLKKS